MLLGISMLEGATLGSCLDGLYTCVTGSLQDRPHQHVASAARLLILLFAPRSAAQVANASGVLFSPLPGRDVEQMVCHGAECDLPLAIWASMVPRSAATAIAEVRWVLSSIFYCPLTFSKSVASLPWMPRAKGAWKEAPCQTILSLQVQKRAGRTLQSTSLAQDGSIRMQQNQVLHCQLQPSEYLSCCSRLTSQLQHCLGLTGALVLGSSVPLGSLQGT